MSTRRPSLHIPFELSDFRAKLEEYTVVPERIKEGWERQPFVRGAALTNWLESSATLPNGPSYASYLLDKAFSDSEHPLYISAKDVLTGNRRCPLMFCILLEMQRGDLVHVLHNSGMHDECLPMPFAELRNCIEHATRFSRTSVEALANEFHEKQWKYFPLLFTHGMRPLPLNIARRLPVCQQSKINGKGGTAEVDMIAIPEEFIDMKLRGSVPHSAFDHPNYGRCYQFALKSFISPSQELFEAEIHAYYNLQNQKHVIKCFGGFSHHKNGDESNWTHSILLEYGECDLAQYFKFVDAPALSEDVNMFWFRFFDVVKAVKDIHSFKADRGGKIESYDGWHGDIKPDNILLSEKQLKLADPGFANWVRRGNNQGEDGIPRVLHGWTSTYGPPEVDENNCAVQEPWAVDMWSLGCVLSEAATWLLLGESGRVAYSKARQDSIKKLRKDAGRSDSNIEKLGDGDFFHDSRSVLPIVAIWHKQVLPGTIRPKDIITKQVLDLIDDTLLLSHPKKRIRADILCAKFTKIQEQVTRSRSQESIPADLKDLIHQARRQALDEWISPSQILEGLSVEDRKACNTTKSAVFTYMARNPDAIKPSYVHSITSVLPTVSLEGDTFLTPAQRYTSPPSMDSVPKMPHRASTDLVSPDAPETLFDAHYERLVAESSPMDRWTKKSRKTKDEHLTGYYKDRDIIFLIDNAGSMKSVWSEVKFAVKELATKARNQDDDGLDLMFTNSGDEIKNAKRDAPDLFSKAVASKNAQPKRGKTTNMAESLNRLLLGWLKSYEKDQINPRKMTVIVLTDGVWNGGPESDDYAVDKTIVEWSKRARQFPYFQTLERPVSIQFVSFGNDPSALARLQRLDDTLRYYDIEDIVDTEPSAGNVRKMLLGSFNPHYDDQNTQQSIPQSPNIHYETQSSISSSSLLPHRRSSNSVLSPSISSGSNSSSQRLRVNSNRTNSAEQYGSSTPQPQISRPESTRAPRASPGDGHAKYLSP